MQAEERHFLFLFYSSKLLHEVVTEWSERKEIVDYADVIVVVVSIMIIIIAFMMTIPRPSL